MSVELTEPQLRALDTGGDTARFIDPRTRTAYRLVPVRPLVEDDEEQQAIIRRIAQRNALARAAGEP